MLQLFFAVAFSAAPLTLYVPPVRSLNLFVEVMEGFVRQMSAYSSRIVPRARLGLSRLITAAVRAIRMEKEMKRYCASRQSGKGVAGIL